MATINRRGFMVGCSSAIAAMAGAKLSYVAFGSPEQEPYQDILLIIFLRGGFDGLNAVPVLGGTDRAAYESHREDIAVPLTGDNALIPLDNTFGLHRSAEPLYDLYQDGMLAIVHATGLPSDTRSHFDAMKEMELGTPGYKNSHTGWLARHLQSGNLVAQNSTIPALSVGSLQPTSLVGSADAVGMNSPDDFEFSGHWRYAALQRAALRNMYSGVEWIDSLGTRTLDAVDLLELGNPGSYDPANGAEYPNGSFGRNLQSVAQMIKMQLGMRIATIDLGGWDTHDSQGNDGGGYFFNHLQALASGLNAFYTDLNGGAEGTNNGHRVTAVVMSEFGRSLKQNGSRGTDHGHGNVMFLLGNQVKGGKVYGSWPGLGTNPDGTSQLYDGRDLAITTDYRQVLSEVLIRRFANPNLGVVFPGYTDYTPINIMNGTDLTPVYGDVVATPGPTPTATPTRLNGTSTLPQPTVTPVPTDMPTPKPLPTGAATPDPSLEPDVYIPVIAN